MTVKLTSIAADLAKEEQGDWIGSPTLPGVEFLVSSLNKPAYVTARDLSLQRLARRYKGKPPPPAEMSAEAGKLYCKHILHGWRGFDVPYSPEKALEILTDPAFRVMLQEVEWCAGQVGQAEVEFIEDAEKNSGAPSATA
jgi:hypothetical protein